ncbi:MAG: hypothetical protein GQ574_22010 [Crocinitomix sp.]|nr:hypothetical protein [Crocinitomix sp.]
MNVKSLLASILMVLVSFGAMAQGEQDSIILLNGRVFLGPVTSVENGILKYQETTKKGETFTGEFATYRVFSYTQKGTETILYKQDEASDNYLSVDEARNATLGSYDARQTFKPRFVFWSSFALGYGMSLFDTYLGQASIDHDDYIGPFTEPGLFKSRPTFAPIFVPLVLSAAWTFPSFKVREKQMIQTHLLNDESYYRGYHRVARQKRIFSALKGSLIGIGAGLVTYAVFKP